ncbi:ABC transporter permease [Acetobacter sp. AN02]|nr:ABC transporter permease [Acetobacter sp. AN02]MDG6095723.1 ABC transporter permease [Acetobacter sp. AN02]
MVQNTGKPEWTFREGQGGAILSLSGPWTSDTGLIPSFSADDLTRIREGDSLGFDTGGLQEWDTVFISFLWDVKQAAGRSGIRTDFSGVPESASKLVSLLPEHPDLPQTISRVSFTPLLLTGDLVVRFLTSAGAVSELAWNTFRSVLSPRRKGQGHMRPADLFRDISDAGPSALLIVSVVNFLLGSILAFVGAVQMRKFSADAYVANLVGIACVRELSAVMTAIIMAGRTGGAYAARISTMLGNEEIDALRVFGIPVTSYLILPSVLSLILTMPLLYLYGCLLSTFGGYIVTVGMLPSVTTAGYWHQLFGAVSLSQFYFGFVKTIFFAAMIAFSSCNIGLQAGRSAADVGEAATRAVVVGIVGVIALDAIFAVIANVIGI